MLLADITVFLFNRSLPICLRTSFVKILRGLRKLGHTEVSVIIGGKQLTLFSTVALYLESSALSDFGA